MGKSTTVASGAAAGISIGSESTWGEPVTPTTHLVDFTSESLAAEENTLESEAISGDRGTKFVRQGTLDVGGDISFENSAEGYGVLMRHALGDYIRLQRVDGGVHGRINHDGLRTISSDPDNGTREIITLAEDHSGGFKEGADSDKFAIVYRDGNDQLQQDPDTTSAATGYNYESYGAHDETTVSSTTTDGNATDPITSSASADKVTLDGVVDLDGNYTEPNFSAEGGVVKLGPKRKEYLYYNASGTGTDGKVELYFPANTLPSSPGWVGDGAQLLASFATWDGGDSAGNTTNLFSTQNSTLGSDNQIVDKGSFVYLYDDTDGTDPDWSGVWTHHLERGEELPTGLTVEVDRQAAVFIYSGMKVESVSLEFETNSIVTGTFTLIGQKEYIHDELKNDVPPVTHSSVSSGSSPGRVIEVKGKAAEHWPNPESGNSISGSSTGHSHLNYVEVTIGEETNIKYVEKKVTKTDGTIDKIELELVDVSGSTYGNDDEIERYHPQDTSVALRTSIQEQDPEVPDLTPLTSFETNVYIDGTFEEAMSGSLTLNNNINGDKYGLGQKERFQLAPEDVELEASLTFEFDDAKHYKRFREAEYFPVEFKCISEAEASPIGSTDVLSQAYYLLPHCKFSGSTPTVDDESFIQSDFPVMPILDTDMNNTDLICIIVNDEKLDVKNS